MGRMSLSCNSSLVNLSSSRAENNQNNSLDLCNATLNQEEVCRHHWSSEISKLSRAFDTIKAGRGSRGKPKLIWNQTRPFGWEGAEIVEFPNQNCALCRESGDKKWAHCSHVITNHNPTAREIRLLFSNFHWLQWNLSIAWMHLYICV